GAGLLLFPHGIHVDREGNVWAVDGLGRAGKGHQVFKFSPEGKVLLTLGKAGAPGSGNDEFNAPSAVVTAPNGDIFVADGHGGNTNARIVKFDKAGRFIKTWGQKGSGPGDLDIPHTIAMDSQGRLFVGDRQNNRIEIFDQDDESQDIRDDEWHHAIEDGRYLGVIDHALDDKDIHADRRMNETELDRHYDDDSEPDGIEAKLRDDRKDDRHREDDHGERVH